MLKLIGAGLVLFGTAGYAFSCKRDLQERLYHTRCLKNILELLESEICYSRSSLPEACRMIGNRVEEPYREGLLSVCKVMEENEGLPFSLIWKKQMGESLQKTAAPKKERTLFLQFADSTGFADHQMQLRVLEQCRECLEQSVKKQEECMENKTKVVMSMGLIGGLFLTIVLL